MSGHLGDLSAAQQAALDELNTKIKDVATARCDNQYLLRFLRSRKFNLDKTEKKLRATLEFRKKYGADTILTDWELPPLCQEYFPWGLFDGLDNTGHPVGCLNAGTFDIRGLLKCMSKETLIKAKVYVMEKMERRLGELSEQSGNLVETVTFVTDLHGLSSYNLTKPSINLFNEFMQIEEMHYPEIVNEVFLIRQPKIFNLAFSLVKNFIDPHTREKLIFCGSDWKERVARSIPASTLPELYGGTNPSMGDVKLGGRVPKENYKQNDETMEKVFVKAGKKHTIEIEVTNPGTDILYEFNTEDHDLGFGVYLQAGDDLEKTYVVPLERTDCHTSSVEGGFQCEKVGTYVLEWDNSFSWTKGKNLCYRYEVTKAEAPPES